MPHRRYHHGAKHILFVNNLSNDTPRTAEVDRSGWPWLEALTCPPGAWHLHGAAGDRQAAQAPTDQRDAIPNASQGVLEPRCTERRGYGALVPLSSCSFWRTLASGCPLRWRGLANRAECRGLRKVRKSVTIHGRSGSGVRSELVLGMWHRFVGNLSRPESIFVPHPFATPTAEVPSTRYEGNLLPACRTTTQHTVYFASEVAMVYARFHVTARHLILILDIAEAVNAADILRQWIGRRFAEAVNALNIPVPAAGLG